MENNTMENIGIVVKQWRNEVENNEKSLKSSYIEQSQRVKT